MLCTPSTAHCGRATRLTWTDRRTTAVTARQPQLCGSIAKRRVCTACSGAPRGAAAPFCCEDCIAHADALATVSALE